MKRVDIQDVPEYVDYLPDSNKKITPQVLINV